MSDELVERLRDCEFMGMPAGRLDYSTAHEAADRIEELEAEIKTLRKGLEIYEQERNRYKHAYPEKTGAYFLAGGLGEIDDNYLPQFVEIVPAYGCGWSQVYEKTDRTISYEGS
jgi:hypothetical protein